MRSARVARRHQVLTHIPDGDGVCGVVEMEVEPVVAGEGAVPTEDAADAVGAGEGTLGGVLLEGGVGLRARGVRTSCGFGPRGCVA